MALRVFLQTSQSSRGVRFVPKLLRGAYSLILDGQGRAAVSEISRQIRRWADKSGAAELAASWVEVWNLI